MPNEMMLASFIEAETILSVPDSKSYATVKELNAAMDALDEKECVREPNAMLRQAIAEAEQICREYADGTRKPVPFTNAHDMIQEILSEEDDVIV